jgi:hypothetical protein
MRLVYGSNAAIHHKSLPLYSEKMYGNITQGNHCHRLAVGFLAYDSLINFMHKTHLPVVL